MRDLVRHFEDLIYIVSEEILGAILLREPEIRERGTRGSAERGNEAALARKAARRERDCVAGSSFRRP